MQTYEQLRQQIESVIDPGFHLPLKDVVGIKKLVIGTTGIVECEIYLKNPKEHETKLKIELIKLVKVTCGFPGIKLNFFPSEFILEGEKTITYIGIISGKGGVGKSTVTAQLALAFNSLGKRVGIIDADIYGPSIQSIFQLESHPLNQTSDERLIPLSSYGIEIVSTTFFMPKDKPLMWRGPMLGKMLIHYFNGVAWHPEIDIVLIDLPPGTGDVALDIHAYVPKSKMIVVTTPHPNAADVAVKAGLGAQQIGHEVLGVIENMSHIIIPERQEPMFIFGQGGGEKVAKILGVPFIGQIPIESPIEGYLHQEGYIFEAFIKIANQIL
jgi:ATP-binding protein involved in chromosome partitioning